MSRMNKKFSSASRATRQVKQGGYLHKNIFDVLHLHQSEGRKYFIRYLKIIIKSRGKNNTSGKTLYRK